MLDDLRTKLAALPHIAALAEILQRHAAEANSALPFVRVAPLLSSARTALVATLVAQQRLPLLYVVQNNDNALRAVEDLQQWLEPAQVVLYPANDILPYDYTSPADSVRSQRLRVLQRLQLVQEQGAPVVVAPLKALQQPTLPPRELTAITSTVRRGDWTAQNTLLQRWIEAGYRTVPMVERPGDMARRGGIVDIWPATDTQPVRIEWFGDEIDSLRRFDAASQRSQQQIDTVSISPPYETAFWRYQQAIEQLSQLDLSGMRPEARDEWQQMLARLESGEHGDGWTFLAPFFRQETWRPGNGNPPMASLLTHLPPGSPVLLSEALLLAQTASEGHERAEEQRNRMVSTGELPSDFPRPYLLWDDLLAQADSLVLLDISNNEELAAPENMQTMLPTAQHELLDDNGEPLFLSADLFGGQLRRLVRDIVGRLREGEDVFAVTPQAPRVQELVNETLARNKREQPPGRLTVIHGALDGGWRLPSAGLTLYTDTEVFGWRQRRTVAERQRRKSQSADERAAFLRGLKPGDYVVHIEHGIAVYEGLLRRTIGGVEREYLNLRYASNDRLYVPVDQVDRVARYVGSGDGNPQLTRLGTQEWERAKRKARAAVQDLADDLLAIYARRQSNTGYSFSPDTEWQHELEDAFPYIETGDQLRALDEIKHDMEVPQPMDRLMCGDVGFGKTEVALRAAFKAVQDGKQVAVLVPTTVLAQQHYNTFTQRMASFPVTIEMLSRFRTAREQSAILQRLLRGSLDIIIGTHRLLSKDVHFKDLGLLIVDEEQRFGVRHKERLKQIRAEVDVLTLTATPIPRTLHMTLAGIRDMSIISTPPEERMPIKTYVVPYDDSLIRDAIRRELDRGGQVYFVHNRVYSIYHVATHLQHLVPEAAVGVAHGQLDERQLEKTMLEFFSGEYDVLVCTTIIENGLDVPNTNTIIIDDATNYGLAQLYQLRGRVGRSANRAYAYLLYRQDKPMTVEARQRLEAIQEATELGSGFRIAMRDLEIRGAGNLLGAEQSGHIAAVGFDLYSRLLEQAVSQLKQGTLQESKQEAPDDKRRAESTAKPPQRGARSALVDEKVLVSPLVTLDLPLTAYLPEDYIADEAVRLGVYQRMATIEAPDDVQDLRQELCDRFGPVPPPADHLLIWLHIKALALRAKVGSVVTTDDEFIVRMPMLEPHRRAALQRHFRQAHDIRVGPQFVRLDRRMVDGQWVEKLTNVLEVLAQ
jgi:transcription-repair coupling factor (superfamily II helicase)